MLVKIESYGNLGHDGSDGEPDEEGGEEAHPREVEGTHVRSFEGQKFDFGGLVILVGIDINKVLVVFLPFGGFS